MRNQQEITHLIDKVVTRRKNRLCILYALFLAHEVTPDLPVRESILAKRLGLTPQALAEALTYLAAAGYIEPSSREGEPAVRLRHSGLAVVEAALVRLDRETLEFPPLRSVLNSDLELGPERMPGEPPTGQ